MDTVFILTRTTTYTFAEAGNAITAEPVLVGAFITRELADAFRESWEANYVGNDVTGGVVERVWEVTEFAPIPF